MPRIRSIKPEHWSDKELPNISLQAQLLWIGMWNFADDKGINEADLFLIKSQIFPRRQDVTIDDVRTWIAQLIKARFLIPFSYKGEAFYITRTFADHQKIDKPKPSNIPQKVIDAALNFVDEPPIDPRRVDDQSSNDLRQASDLIRQKTDAEVAKNTSTTVENEFNDLSVNVLRIVPESSTTDRRSVDEMSSTGEERIGVGEDKERIRRGDSPPRDASEDLIFDVENALLTDQARYESICMKTRKPDNLARDSLRKYHLHILENQGYPKPKEALYAGFEKWLMNEKIPKNATSNSQPASNGKSAGAVELADKLAAKLAARGS